MQLKMFHNYFMSDRLQYRIDRCMLRTHSDSGFTLIELLVVIAIISLLVSILIPSLKAAKEIAKTSICQQNLRNCMLAAMIYHSDNQDARIYIYSGGAAWCKTKADTWFSMGQLFASGLLEPPSAYCSTERFQRKYKQEKDAWNRDPNNDDIIKETYIARRPFSYGHKDRYLRYDSIGSYLDWYDCPTGVIVWADWSLYLYHDGLPWSWPPEHNQGDGANAVYLDGHVEFWKQDDIENAKANESFPYNEMFFLSAFDF